MKNNINSNKILLLSVPFSAKGAIAGPKMENQGLCYIKAYLKHHGFEVHMVDGNAAEIPWSKAINELNFNDYFLIGFSVYSTNYSVTAQHIKAIKSSGFKGHVTMGGHYPTFCYKIILEKNPGLDSVVLGEGEVPILKLARALNSSKKWNHLAGLAFRKGNKVRFNRPEGLINPLKFSFLPDRKSYGDLFKKQKFATISSSRGCWGNCSFCSVRSFYKLGKGPCWRPREVKEIVDEIEFLNKKLEIPCFAFCDDNFIGTGEAGKKRAGEIASEIMNRGLDIAYAIDCRPDDVEEELLTFLHKSGMTKVNIGVESFVERQQKLYSKKLSQESVERAINILKKLDVLIAVYTILFDPYVTLEELSFNLKCALETGPENFPEFATFLQLFPGIPLYDEFKEKNLINNHKILQTQQNEYWINYNFQNPGIEELFVMFLEFEITIDHIIAPFTGVFGTMAGEKYYNLHKEIRTLVCRCFLEAIEKIKSLKSLEEFNLFKKNHIKEWTDRTQKLVASYK